MDLQYKILEGIFIKWYAYTVNVLRLHSCQLMKENFRIIDVNLNRASEALRIIEEVARFKLDDEKLTEKFKTIRHKINHVLSDDYNSLIAARNASEDVGYEIKNDSSRSNLQDILKANFKRCQQALRVLEEYSKIDQPEISGIFEAARYDLYTLEKTMSSKALIEYKKKRIDKCKLYLVTDRSKFDNNDNFFDSIASAIKGGVDIVQLREKTASAKEIMALAKVVKEICALNDTLFIINDRVDLVYAVKADGVHLGQEDMDMESARSILGAEAIIGRSTHKPEDAINAMKEKADYIGVGPVFTTPTKPGREAVGFEYVKWACSNVNIPFFAIGGINNENINDVVSSGAKRIAVVRAIMNADKPDIVSKDMKEKLEKVEELV